MDIADFYKFKTLQDKSEILGVFLLCLDTYKHGFLEAMRSSFGEKFSQLKIEEANAVLASEVYQTLIRLNTKKIESFFISLSRDFEFQILHNIINEITKFDGINHKVEVIAINESYNHELSIDCVDRIDLRNYPFEVKPLSRYILAAHQSDPIHKSFKVNLQIEGE